MCDRPDDPSIPDEECLLRRVLDEWVYRSVLPPRPTSAEFKDGGNEVSVFISRLTGKDMLLRDRPRDSLVEITAGQARAVGFKVRHDPAHGLVPNDPSHIVLCPDRSADSWTKSSPKKLADAARWIVLRDRTPS